MNVWICAAAAAALSVSPVSATTVVIAHDYAPADINLGTPLATAASLGVGDTLDLTLRFATRVSVVGESGLWPLLYTELTESLATLATHSTLEFLGASSNVVAGPIAIGQDDGLIHLGNFHFPFLYRLDEAPISFTGLREVITIDSDDLGAPRRYGTLNLIIAGGTVSAAAPGTVPEPATWSLMIAGIGLVGTAVRRRRGVAPSVR